MINLEKLKQAREAATPGPWMSNGRTLYAKGQTDTYSGVVWGPLAAIHSLEEFDAEGRNWSAVGDRLSNATLIAMAPDLADAVIELAGALGEIANQLRIEEMNAQMIEGADWEYGYDKCIEAARAALAKHIKGERT